jgi:hypothetical protein
VKVLDFLQEIQECFTEKKVEDEAAGRAEKVSEGEERLKAIQQMIDAENERLKKAEEERAKSFTKEVVTSAAATPPEDLRISTDAGTVRPLQKIQRKTKTASSGSGNPSPIIVTQDGQSLEIIGTAKPLHPRPSR